MGTKVRLARHGSGILDIPVEFLNAETSFAEKGFMLLDGQESTIDLRLKMTLRRQTYP